MTKLSVNINKVATIRNARGGNTPDLLQVARDCELYGADGITVHPRPDERHIRRADVPALRAVVRSEFNIEGYPSKEFLDLVLKAKPNQVTLVPDKPGQLTSDNGWDTVTHQEFLKDVLDDLRDAGIRSSIFINADSRMAEYAAKAGADRVELYTGPYAEAYTRNREAAIEPFLETARRVRQLGIGLNAGHDLSLVNLRYFVETIPWVDEVSIGHALICDALYMGLEKTITAYKDCLKK
jgi:pyridoxine 5-phosphate synthase